jgi:hypothetical protein
VIQRGIEDEENQIQDQLPPNATATRFPDGIKD